MDYKEIDTARHAGLIRNWKHMFEHWDDVRPTAKCHHCGGTGLAPGDGRTECGFCSSDPVMPIR